MTPTVTALQPRVHIRIASTPDELEQVRPVWEKLNWNPLAQMDFCRLINEARQNVIGSRILVIERDGTPAGLIIGRLALEGFGCRLGYKSVVLGRVRQLSILYGGILGCDNSETAEAVFAELSAMLRRREVEIVHFNSVDTRSPLFQAAARGPGFWCRDRLIATQPHWKTALPATPAELVQRLSKKRRHWLRSLDKQLQKDFPEQVSYRSFSGGQELELMMRDLESVASKTYQRRLGAGYRQDAEFTQRLAFQAERGWLRAHVLYIANNPCAFWMGTLYKGVFYSDATGYDPNLRKYGIGTLIFMKLFEHLCQERIEAIDYGLGDALYKRRFGDQNWTEASLIMYAPTLRGISLNLARTILEGPARCLKSILVRTRLEQRLKTLWRKRLVSDEES